MTRHFRDHRSNHKSRPTADHASWKKKITTAALAAVLALLPAATMSVSISLFHRWREWHNKPTLQVSASVFAIFRKVESSDDLFRDFTTLYDVHQGCLLTSLDVVGLAGALESLPSSGDLISQVYLENRSDWGVTGLPLAFRSHLPGEMKIEASPNLIFTARRISSEFAGTEELVTIAKLRSKTASMITVRQTLSPSSFSLELDSPRSALSLDGKVLNVNPYLLTSEISLLVADQQFRAQGIELISAEESLKRYASLALGSTVVLPTDLRLFRNSPMQLNEYDARNSTCTTSPGWHSWTIDSRSNGPLTVFSGPDRRL